MGATGTVTGSRFLLEHAGKRILVDAGLFQGIRELRRRNWAPFPVPPASLDAVVLSHAHLDHCGYLPRLVAGGFAGPVLATGGTARLAGIVLADSARLQEEDAAYAGARGYSKHAVPEPLYTQADVEATLRLLVEVDHGAPYLLPGDVRLMLRRAGHILGSCSVVLGLGERTLTFSGDLGRGTHPLLRGPDPPPDSDVIVVESTYGDRKHPPADEAHLAELIRGTAARGGVVLVPAFAVDRTEVFLLTLGRLREAGAIPDLPVHVDSPMALAALEVYREAISRGDPEIRPEAAASAARLLGAAALHEAHSAEQSKALNDPGGPCIIVSASGMAAGGRVVHHLRHLLPDPRNTVLLVGFQAVGTRGRDLLDGATMLKMHGRYVPVRAEVAAVDEFSVHADAEELIGWLGRAPRVPGATYVVHGEPDAAEALARAARTRLGHLAVVARTGERVRCD